jgi:hypothetical protein
MMAVYLKLPYEFAIVTVNSTFILKPYKLKRSLCLIKYLVIKTHEERRCEPTHTYSRHWLLETMNCYTL